MRRKKLFRIMLAVGLMLVVVAVVVGPTLAALVWEHEWDHRTVLFEVPKGEGLEARSEGYSSWVKLEGTRIANDTYSCAGSMSARVYVYAKPDKDIIVRVACAQMTPTLAPTQRP